MKLWFAIFVVLFIVSAAFLVISMIYRYLRKGRLRKVAFIFPLSIVMFVVFTVYQALNPGDGFYLDEFKDNAGYKVLHAAKVVKMSASYPDLYGKYSSCAVIKLDVADYDSLLQHIKTDSSFRTAPGNIEVLPSSDANFKKAAGNERTHFSSASIKVTDSTHSRYLIEFLNDGSSVVSFFSNK